MFWSTVGVQRRVRVPACHIAPFPGSVKMAYSPSRVSRWRRRADSWGQSEMHCMTPAGGWPGARLIFHRSVHGHLENHCNRARHLKQSAFRRMGIHTSYNPRP
jgi:hypothetical protein